MGLAGWWCSTVVLADIRQAAGGVYPIGYALLR
jgi:hypothetical protein